MTFEAFHNALRILRSIDADEFLQAVHGIDREPLHETPEWRDWQAFRDHPHDWFIRAPTAKSRAIWAIVEARQPEQGRSDPCPTTRPTSPA